MSIENAIDKIWILKRAGEYRQFAEANATQSGSMHEYQEKAALTEAQDAASDFPDIAGILRAASEALDAAYDAYCAFISARDAAYEFACAVSENPGFDTPIETYELERKANELSIYAQHFEKYAQVACDTVYNARCEAQGVDEDEDEDDEENEDGEE